MEQIVFPDPVAALVADLSIPGYADVPVVGRIPNPRPSRFVRALRIGGPRRDIVADNAMLTIEAWAESDAQSALLAQATRAAVNALAGTVLGGAAVYEVTELSGPANLPDPDSSQSRHTWTVEIAMRGAAA